MALLRKGDPFAVEMMYDLFAPMLYGVALKLVQNETKAEDLIQKVFLHFYNNHSSFDETKQNIYLWLVSITTTYAQEKVHLVSHFQNQKPLFYVNTDVGEKILDSPPLFKDSEEEVVFINADQKNILDLVFFGGKKISTVAKSLGMDENKIKKLLHEAVKNHRKEQGTWK